MLMNNPPLAGAHAGQRQHGRRRLRGFGNLLRNEHAAWWHTRRWLVHLVLWPALLNGFVVVAAFSTAREPTYTAVQIAEMVTVFFFLGSGQATAFGAVVATQSAIVGEKQRGTLAWIMSKPVSRSAFVLAKLAAHMLGFLSLAIALPCAIFYAQSVLLWGAWPDPGIFLGSVLLVMLHALFYLALALLLGTLARGSGTVAGIAIGALLAGLLGQERVGRLVAALPWKLPALASLYATQPELANVWMPVVASVTWTALFVAVALWRFRREEF